MNNNVDWAALYKEVTGKDLVYLSIEDIPAETKAVMEYFANKEEE